MHVDGDPSDVRVLRCHPGGAIDHEDRDVGTLDGTGSAHDGVPLNSLAKLAGAAHPRGIDEQKGTGGRLDLRIHSVPSRARHIADDDALFAKDRVDEAGLANVRAPDYCHAHAVGLGKRRRRRELPDDFIEHKTDVDVMQRAHRECLAKAEGRRIGDASDLAAVVVGLGGDEHSWPVGPAHDVGHVVVASGKPIARIDAEEHECRMLQRGLYLVHDEGRINVLGTSLESTRIDEAKAEVAPLDICLDAVACGSRLVLHDRAALSENAVEERRLPNIRATDDNDTRKIRRFVHGEAAFKVTWTGSTGLAFSPAGSVTVTG